MMPTYAERVRTLNDEFRKTLPPTQHRFTEEMKELGTALCAEVLEAVRTFDTFNLDNDPYGEHDYGFFTLGKEYFIWEIAYYDYTLQYGSKNPADPSQTTRMITIMLAHEY
jgi:hypothetical protein